MISVLDRKPVPAETAAPAVELLENGIAGKDYLPGMDGLRAIAALAVVAFHSFVFARFGNPVADRFVLWLGTNWWCIELLFVISGFLLTRILIRTRTKPYFFRNFYCRRMLRVFPLYYLIVAVAALIMLSSRPSPAELWRAVKELPCLLCFGLNILLSTQHAWRPTIGAYLAHCWSLCVEVHYYLLWPIAFFFIPARKLRWFALAALLIASGARAIYVLSTGDCKTPYMLTVFRLDGLMLGSVAALSLSDTRHAAWFAKNSRIILFLSAIPICLLVRFCGLSLRNPFVSAFGYTLVAIFLTALVSAVSLNAGRGPACALSHPVLVWIGRRSYAIFLFHGIVLCLLDRCQAIALLGSVVHSSSGAFLISRILAVLITSLMAICSWHFIERRCFRLKERFS